MSSYLRIISSEEPVIPSLTGLALIKWVLSNVKEDEFGTCQLDKVYLNWSELSWGMYTSFKEAVYKLTKNEYRGTYVFIPNAIMQTLWNEHTLSIEHQRLGPFSKEEWIKFCNTETVKFFVYVN